MSLSASRAQRWVGEMVCFPQLFFFFFYPPADGEKYSFSSPHFHVFSYASCVDLTQLLSQPNASWRTLRIPLYVVLSYVSGGGMNCVRWDICVSEYHTQLAKMSFDKIFDLTAGVYFNFCNMRAPPWVVFCFSLGYSSAPE